MTEIELQIQKDIIQILDVQVSNNIYFEDFTVALKEYINYLIENNFQNLISILYKTDINENQLKHLLYSVKNKDVASIITELIIDRQLNKISTRQEFSSTKNYSEQEKW